MATTTTANPSALEAVTTDAREGRAIKWYRTKLDKDLFKDLHSKSDALGFAQTLGYLGLVLATNVLTVYSSLHWAWWITLLCFFLHGTVSSFMINAVHELGHGTVFKTKGLNSFFCHIFAFLGWINHERFQESHSRHHRYTLHAPDDLEVVLPIKFYRKNYFKQAIFNYNGVRFHLKEIGKLALGRFEGEWNQKLFPDHDPQKKVKPVRWARVLIAGHLAVLLVAMLTGWWALIFTVSLAPFTANWLFFLCNNGQHVGLHDHISDFRMCCRTFTCNPVVQFLYWHMNFHIEHHMYAAVPCYKLGRLHRAIRHDLPHCPHGLKETWVEIGDIIAKQDKDPDYLPEIRLPTAA